MSGDDVGVFIPVPWDRLRAWINEQEALEKKQHSQQATTSSISRPQLQALSLLIPLTDEEPELDNTDWVSRLMCLVQSRKLNQPVFQDLEVIDIPVAGYFAQRWRTVCFLPHLTNIGQFLSGFPSLGFGIDDEEKGVPMFKSKKLAKQYAAKHAHAFLQGAPPSESSSQGIKRQQSSAQASPAGGGGGGGGASLLKSPLSQTTSSSSMSSISRESASSLSAAGSPGSAPMASDGDDPVSKTPSLVPRSPGSPNVVIPSHLEKSNGDFSNESGPSVLSRVSALAGRLGLGSPNFEVEEEIGQLGFFSGRAVFKNTAPVPPGLGTVTGVLGKKNAKFEAAARVLQWLEMEERRRRSIHEDILQDL